MLFSLKTTSRIYMVRKAAEWHYTNYKASSWLRLFYLFRINGWLMLISWILRWCCLWMTHLKQCYLWMPLSWRTTIDFWPWDVFDCYGRLRLKCEKTWQQQQQQDLETTTRRLKTKSLWYISWINLKIIVWMECLIRWAFSLISECFSFF